MSNNEKGLTLIEVIIALSLFAILSFISISTPSNIYDRTLLKSTAIEIKSALNLSQQLSLDESKEYCVEIVGDNRFRVKEYIKNGKIVLNQEFHKNILISSESDKRIFHNRNGETSYGKFILINKKGKKIIIDTLIGTGKVRISEVY